MSANKERSHVLTDTYSLTRTHSYIHSYVLTDTYSLVRTHRSGGLMMVPSLFESSIIDGELVYADLVIYPISPTHATPHTYPMLDPDPNNHQVDPGDGAYVRTNARTHVLIYMRFQSSVYFILLRHIPSCRDIDMLRHLCCVMLCHVLLCNVASLHFFPQSL